MYFIYWSVESYVMNAQRGVLLLLIAALSYLSFQLVQPYFPYLIGAVLLAYIFSPIQAKLETRISPTAAAALLVVGATVALLFPLAVLLTAVAGDAIRFAQAFAADDITGQIGPAEAWLAEQFNQDVNIVAEVATRIEGLAGVVLGTAPDIIGILANATIGLGLAVFVLFYLLRDGDQLMVWIRSATPLPESVQTKLYTRVDDMTRAVLLGHVLVAVIQGAIAGLGLLVVGISNILLWTSVMVLLALLPFIGTFLVWGPASIYLLSTGDLLGGGFLLVYGTIIVGISDEYLRPVIVDRYAEVSPAIIVIGVIGGLSAFGVMGLFIGPVIVGALKAAIEVFDEQYEQL